MNMSYFAKADKAAQLSDFKRYHIGCIVVYKNKILSVGFNSYKTHPIQKIYNKERYEEDDTPHCLHAEICALCFLRHRSDIEWNKVELYISRKNRANINRLAKPCDSCMKMIKDLGIRYIHYTTNNGYETFDILDNKSYEIKL